MAGHSKRRMVGIPSPRGRISSLDPAPRGDVRPNIRPGFEPKSKRLALGRGFSSSPGRTRTSRMITSSPPAFSAEAFGAVGELTRSWQVLQTAIFPSKRHPHHKNFVQRRSGIPADGVVLMRTFSLTQAVRSRSIMSHGRCVDRVVTAQDSLCRDSGLTDDLADKRSGDEIS